MIKIVKQKFNEYIYDRHPEGSAVRIFMDAGNDIFNSHPAFNKGSPLMHRYIPPNEGYHILHCDWATAKPHTAMRSCIAMVYLNDVHIGGETEFYHQGMSIQPTQGTLVIWPAFFTHLHKGHPPISNSKYIINQWLISRI